jgi:hypothetical protein
MCIYYIIYKTTNIVNGFEYIGQHTTSYINDGYFGSGKRLKNAIKQYGKESFKKEILHIFKSFDEMNQKEIELVNESYIKRVDTYNIVLGGDSGIGKNNKGKVPWNKGISGVIKYSEESKRKMSESGRKPKSLEHRNNISKATKGKSKKPLSNEHKEKISASKKGKIKSIETKHKMSIAKKGKLIGIIRSIETRKKISEKMKASIAKRKAAKAASLQIISEN